MTFIGSLKGTLASGRGQLDSLLSALYPKLKTDPSISLVGKTALVTGANVGIGFETALDFAQRGAFVYLLCRSQKKAEDARQEIVDRSKNKNVFVEVVDLASEKSVKEFVQRWIAKGQTIDILVNNAGVVNVEKFTTDTGHEHTYQTNHLSAFYLTNTLLNESMFSPSARIIQVSSQGAYAIASTLTPEQVDSADLLPQGEGSEGQPISFQHGMTIYSRSKAMQIVYTIELQKKLAKSDKWKDIVVQAAHPGTVTSSIWGRERNSTTPRFVTKAIIKLAMIVGISPQQGAQTTVWLAVAPKPAEEQYRGLYWDRQRVKWLRPWLWDGTARANLWAKWVADSGVDLQL